MIILAVTFTLMGIAMYRGWSWMPGAWILAFALMQMEVAGDLGTSLMGPGFYTPNTVLVLDIVGFLGLLYMVFVPRKQSIVEKEG